MDDEANGSDQDEAAREFAEHRPALVSVAYRLLGSVADAEDAVQEAWLRWSERRPDDVENPRAYLIKVTSRLAIDRLRRNQARREAYIGPWLPEPFPTTADAADDVVLAESLSVAFMLVLETLSPLERAVYVLREAFEFPYAEIAGVLGSNEAAVRQVARRARSHVSARRPRFDLDHQVRLEVTERFMAACETADFASLLDVLAPGVVLVSDGGGQARGPRRPIEGAAKVMRFFLGIVDYPVPDLGFRMAELNGGPGLIVTSRGVPITTFVLELEDGLVQRINVIANPNKLARLRLDG
ncbi:MAG: RNA polymerase sigma-70 factor [Propionibacteriales bacterium]|nr:RNA polymerase sigma-70 factor [Propionibacteriales bacterium]